MSIESRNLSVTLASLLLAGNLAAFHAFAALPECSPEVLSRAIDLFAIFRRF